MKRINVYASSNRQYTASIETLDREGNSSGREFARLDESAIDRLAQYAYAIVAGNDCDCFPFLGSAVGYSLRFQNDVKALAMWELIKEGEVGN